MRIGAGSTVRPGAVLRGDQGRITVGEPTSMQDGTAELAMTIGDDCMVGHIAHLEGCTVQDR